METVRLAVCIPTYRRPDVIREFMENMAYQYIQHGFSVYIYDSSEDDSTERIVREWMSRYARVYYVGIDSSVQSNVKVYNIFREYGELQEYDYLWVCSDYIRWTRKALDAVCACANQEYDIIVPNYQDVEKIGNQEYTDMNSFFLDCAWHMTLFGAAVLKVSTMLTRVDWNALIEKYIVPDCIYHSHVAFYFEKLAVMSGWKAKHLSFAKSDMMVSAFRKYSGWHKDVFYVWCHCWPEMINRLPKCYNNKKDVIKKIGVNSGILSFENLKKLRRQNIFDNGIYNCYKDQWRNLTNVPVVLIWGLSKIPSEWINRREYKEEKILKKRIRRFCGKYDHIYIFGAGRKASRYTGYLNEMNLSFNAYLVTETGDNVREKENHQVIQFSKELVYSGNSGILLALNEENAKEAMDGILHDVDQKRIFREFR